MLQYGASEQQEGASAHVDPLAPHDEEQVFVDPPAEFMQKCELVEQSDEDAQGLPAAPAWQILFTQYGAERLQSERVRQPSPSWPEAQTFTLVLPCPGLGTHFGFETQQSTVE